MSSVLTSFRSPRSQPGSSSEAAKSHGSDSDSYLIREILESTIQETTETALDSIQESDESADSTLVESDERDPPQSSRGELTQTSRFELGSLESVNLDSSEKPTREAPSEPPTASEPPTMESRPSESRPSAPPTASEPPTMEAPTVSAPPTTESRPSEPQTTESKPSEPPTTELKPSKPSAVAGNTHETDESPPKRRLQKSKRELRGGIAKQSGVLEMEQTITNNIKSMGQKVLTTIEETVERSIDGLVLTKKHILEDIELLRKDSIDSIECAKTDTLNEIDDVRSLLKIDEYSTAPEAIVDQLQRYFSTNPSLIFNDGLKEIKKAGNEILSRIEEKEFELDSTASASHLEERLNKLENQLLQYTELLEKIALTLRIQM